MKKIITSLLLFFLSFITDSATYYFLAFPYAHALLVYTIVTFLSTHHWLPFILGITALTFQGFLLYDVVGINYLYLIPLFMIIGILKQFLHSRLLVATSGLITAITFETFFLVLCKGSAWPSFAYTFIQIGVNLILSYRYLKCFPTAGRGNRF